MARIDFAEYIDSLVTYLRQMYGVGGVSLEVNITPVYLTIEQAIPCGLIANELVSNAMNHAFPNGRTGKIWIELGAVEDGQLSLVVGDDGVGFPPDIDFRRTTSLGLTLVNTLVKQLNGTIELQDEAGTAFKILFSKSYKQGK